MTTNITDNGSIKDLKMRLKRWLDSFVKILKSLPGKTAISIDIQSVYNRRMSKVINDFYYTVQDWLDEYWTIKQEMPSEIFIINEIFPVLYELQTNLLKELSANGEKHGQLSNEIKEEIESLLGMEENDLVSMIKGLSDE